MCNSLHFFARRPSIILDSCLCVSVSLYIHLIKVDFHSVAHFSFLLSVYLILFSAVFFMDILAVYLLTCSVCVCAVYAVMQIMSNTRLPDTPPTTCKKGGGGYRKRKPSAASNRTAKKKINRTKIGRRDEDERVRRACGSEKKQHYWGN